MKSVSNKIYQKYNNCDSNTKKAIEVIVGTTICYFGYSLYKKYSALPSQAKKTVKSTLTKTVTKAAAVASVAETVIRESTQQDSKWVPELNTLSLLQLINRGEIRIRMEEDIPQEVSSIHFFSDCFNNLRQVGTGYDHISKDWVTVIRCIRGIILRGTKYAVPPPIQDGFNHGLLLVDGNNILRPANNRVSTIPGINMRLGNIQNVDKNRMILESQSGKPPPRNFYPWEMSIDAATGRPRINPRVVSSWGPRDFQTLTTHKKNIKFLQIYFGDPRVSGNVFGGRKTFVTSRTIVDRERERERMRPVAKPILEKPTFSEVVQPESDPVPNKL